jgi:type IV secretion system protein TrbC
MSMSRRAKKWLARAATIAACIPNGAAYAATAGGGGMPYSQGLNTFSTSVRGEVAAILIIIGVVGGVGLWIAGGQLEGLLQTIARVIIGACIVGGVVVFLTTIGVTGALV